MAGELPDPLVPANADCRQLDGFLLNVERLLASELWALSTGDELKAALGLWCRAWKQVPAGSLPDDERVLAQFSGAGRLWAKVRDMALHGFVKCNDGRLYHPVLCEDVRRAVDRQKQYRDRRDKDAERIRKWRLKRDGNADGNADETRYETGCETRSTVQGQGQGHSPSGSNEPSEREGAASAPGSLSPKFKISEEWIAEAHRQRAEAGLPEVNLAAEARKFLNQLADKTGPPSRAAWLNWALNARAAPTATSRPNGRYDAGYDAPVQRDRPTGPPPRVIRDAD